MSAWVTLTYRSAEQTITRNYYRSSVRALSAHHTFCHLFGKLPIHQKSEGGGKLSVITLQGRDHTSSLTVTTRPVQPQDMPTVLLRALGARGDELLPLRLMRLNSALTARAEENSQRHLQALSCGLEVLSGEEPDLTVQPGLSRPATWPRNCAKRVRRGERKVGRYGPLR